MPIHQTKPTLGQTWPLIPNNQNGIKRHYKYFVLENLPEIARSGLRGNLPGGDGSVPTPTFNLGS